MKKTWLAMAVLAMALGATACSSDKGGETAATTVAESTTAATQASESAETEETEEEVEEESMTGVITGINGDILTVLSDDDGNEKDYDISKAEVSQEFPFSEGDLVEIMFPYETTEDPVPAISVEVLESVIAQNTDPSATGTVKEADDTTLTLEMEGESYSINIANAYVVAADGIAAGKEATVTYIGDLDDEAMAVKVVMEDSYDTEEAKLNAFVGKVVQSEENNIVLESANEDFYTFVSDDTDFTKYNAGETLRIFYTGTITDKEITADKVEKLK